MSWRACPREKEVSELVARGQWPAASGDEQRAHVENCRACGELALVMGAFQAARHSAAGPANAEPAGAVWWRAQLRRRRAALERMNRPIVGAQIFALAIAVVGALALVLWQARHGVAWLSQLAQSSTFHLDELWASSSGMPAWGLLALVCCVAGAAIVGGLAYYIDRPER